MRLALAVLILMQILEVVVASDCPVRSQGDPVMLTNSWRINSDADRSDVGKYFPGYVYRRATSYDVHYCSLLCAKDRKCKSFNYIEKDYKCHINEKDRASSDPPDEDLYQFESQWVPRIKGLIDMKDSIYYSRDYYQLKKPLNDPCLTSSCKEDEVCSPYYVKQGNEESDPVLSYSCQKNKFSLSDFHVQWSHWNAWSQCTTTCGYGIEVRNRTCEDEAKSWKCRGESRQARRCADVPCPQWAAWGIWGECLSQENCGKGEQLRSRTCQGSLELDACIGDPTSSRPCLLPSCKTPHILSNITSGFVFIYDDTRPENQSWKGDPELDSSRKKSIVRTICRGIGFAFGILRDNANETLTTKLYLKPKSCAINETFLMNCNHDGWKEFKDCQKQLNVYCYDAEHYTRNDIQTYKDFSTLCQSKGKQLCSYEEIFPHKAIPIITGITGGDSWAPIRDDFNDWVQVGGELGRLAEKHSTLYGPPPWGLVPEQHQYLKGNVYCCSVIFPKWADWTSWADRQPARKCGRKWQYRIRRCLHNKLRPVCEGPESEPRLINLPKCGSEN
ncbi:unnamed protein product [Clavelina lepadiformis]|uniref:Uncharacterized protein n=1 Tax=Clavelina lepadiformis TaxID=159417 RepID=A0ABP0GUV8_CLALP